MCYKRAASSTDLSRAREKREEKSMQHAAFDEFRGSGGESCGGGDR
jgi:hypothetical protein